MIQIPGVKDEKLTVPTVTGSIERIVGKLMLKDWKAHRGLKIRHEWITAV